MIAEDSDKERRLLHAHQLLAAIERGDAAAEAQALEALYGLHESALYSDLNRIAGELRKVLTSVPFTGELSRYAQSELPDAQQRLKQVLELTEAAAHASLTAVEKALPIVKSVTAAVGQFGESWRDAGLPPQCESGLRNLLSTIVTETEIVEKCLSDVLIAQGFQDLTGQIIRRVAELVAELERLLSRFSVGDVAAPKTEPDGDRLRRGTGPALPGRDDGSTVRGQQDVDDLLGQLGL